MENEAVKVEVVDGIHIMTLNEGENRFNPTFI